MPRLTAAGYIAALPAVLRQRAVEESFRVYVTDSLQAIAENTAVSAAYLTDGKAGKAMETRWAAMWDDRAEGGNPEPEEELSPEQVIARIQENIKALPPG